MKTCCTCKCDKPIEDFNRNKVRKDGYNTICRECSNVRSKKYYKENKEKHIKVVGNRNKDIRQAIRKKINQIKLTHGCSLCPEKEPCCLDFHHIDTKTKLNLISELQRYCNWKRVSDELSKCMLLCSNCHRKLHNNIIQIEDIEKFRINPRIYLLDDQTY